MGFSILVTAYFNFGPQVCIAPETILCQLESPFIKVSSCQIYFFKNHLIPLQTLQSIGHLTQTPASHPFPHVIVQVPSLPVISHLTEELHREDSIVKMGNIDGLQAM